MGRKSKYSPKTKLEIVLKTLESKSATEVARKYGVSVHLISTWKKQMLDSADL